MVDDPDSEWPTEGLRFTVEGQEWGHAKALIVLHKPTGYECSLAGAWPGCTTSCLCLCAAVACSPWAPRPGHHRSALMTDDGPLLHKLTSPKHHVPKIYEATTKHPITQAQCDKLLAGVVLEDDPKPVKAEGAEIAGETPAATDPDRRQVPPGQAHGGGRQQPGRSLCTVARLVN